MNGDSSQSSPIFRGICRVLLLSTRAYRSVIDASPQFDITSCQSENITDAIAAALVRCFPTSAQYGRDGVGGTD